MTGVTGTGVRLDGPLDVVADVDAEVDTKVDDSGGCDDGGTLRVDVVAGGGGNNDVDGGSINLVLVVRGGCRPRPHSVSTREPCRAARRTEPAGTGASAHTTWRVVSTRPSERTHREAQPLPAVKSDWEQPVRGLLL